MRGERSSTCPVSAGSLSGTLHLALVSPPNQTHLRCRVNVLIEKRKKDGGKTVKATKHHMHLEGS